jgi:ClpP class serine protease
MRAIDAVLGQPWAIQSEWLQFIAAIAQRQFDAPIVAAMQDNPPRAVDRGLQVRNGVAVVGITGPIFPRANMMTRQSGATSLSEVQADFRTALADPSISAIVLAIDSPGGVTTGIGDFSAEIRAARAVKPIVAVAAGMMASAAYELGAAASSVVVSPTAMVGSIGVVAGMTKQVQPDAQGEISIEIVSSNAPKKRPDPTDSAGRGELQQLVDGIEAEFIASVAASRGVTIDKVKSDFGQGGVLVGARAVAAGMADRLGTLDSVLTGLAAAGPVNRATPRAAAAASSENPDMTTFSSIAALTAAYPDLVAQIRQEALAGASSTATDAALAAARAEGMTAERERILGIEAVLIPGHEKLVAQFKADGTTTPGGAAIAINAAERTARGATLGNLAADGQAGPAAAPSAAPAPAAVQTAEQLLADKTRPVADRCKAAFEADAGIRETHVTVERFTAYQTAIENGSVRKLRAK